MNGLATHNPIRQTTHAQPAQESAEGETTPGDIIVGTIGCIGSAYLILEALYMIWRMYS